MNTLQSRSARRNRGFTLIELMIVVTVLGILVGVAVPVYSDSVRKARRGQAKSDMVEAAQLMERRYTLNGKYDGKTLKQILGSDQSPRTGTAHYTLTMQSDAKSFTIRATPSTATGQNKDKCGEMTLNQIGTKTAASTDGCWD